MKKGKKLSPEEQDFIKVVSKLACHHQPSQTSTPLLPEEKVTNIEIHQHQ